MSMWSWPRPTRQRGLIDRTIREHFVYWIYDNNGECLYVGLTCQPERRWYQHKRANPEMACRAAKFRMAGPYTIDTAGRIELEQQRILTPPYGASAASHPDLLTVAQVAEKWKASIRTVQRYIAEGHLKAIRLPGGQYRIRPEDAADAIEAAS